jgi:uncharacterized protein YciI
MEANMYAPSESVQTPSLRRLYFVLWTMGELFPAQRSFRSIDLSRHERYLQKAFREGSLVVAAAFENGSGVISLMEAESEMEVQQFVRNCPDVLDRILQARIKPCTPLFWKVYGVQCRNGG